MIADHNLPDGVPRVVDGVVPLHPRRPVPGEIQLVPVGRSVETRIAADIADALSDLKRELVRWQWMTLGVNAALALTWFALAVFVAGSF